MNFTKLFSFFKKKEYSYRCKLLNNNLHFTSRNTLEPCCSINIGPAFIADISQCDNISDFIEKKQEYIKKFENGDIPESCKNCISIEKFIKKDTKHKPDYLIKKITLNHYIACDCACIYCTQGNTTLESIKQNQNKKIYDVKKFIQELYDNDLIDKFSLFVEVQGGNISCLKDHNELLEIFLKNGVNKIMVYTNNIVYIPVLENILINKQGGIITSLDCGTPETFYKIKQVDKFNKYIENLKQYISVAGNEDIHIKYIIIRDVNDNINEITNFINLMSDIGIKHIYFDVDYRDIIGSEVRKIPRHYKKLIEFAEQLSNEKEGLSYSIVPYAKQRIEEGHSLKNR